MHGNREPSSNVLQAYLLGSVDFETMLRWQRRLVYSVSDDRTAAYLVLCEHSPLISVGRQGSLAHIQYDLEELRVREWPVRWINRGGGCNLHLPGQLAIYSIVPLDRLALDLPAYISRLADVITRVAADFSVAARIGERSPNLYVGNRPIALLGAAVRHWIAYYGAVLNVNPALELFRNIRTLDPHELPMTSLERERTGRVLMAQVRERIIEHFTQSFGFARTSLFFDHPALSRKAVSDVVAAGR